MNDLVFIILIYMGQEGNIASFKSPVVPYETIKACDEARVEMFGKNENIYKRSRCVAVFPATEPDKPVVEVKPEAPKAKCVRPPSAGFAAGRPCKEA